MLAVQRTISPVDGTVYVERPYATAQEIDSVLGRAAGAQTDWKRTSIPKRAAICTRFVDTLIAETAEIIPELSWQMGRPVSAVPSEIRGFAERAHYMIKIAASALVDVETEPKPGFTRFIHREPLGVVLTIAAWNYPYLIAVNSVVPAIMAGNAVVLKHSAQTPLCAERFARCFQAAGLPDDVFQVLHMDHAGTARAIGYRTVAFVAFTGSVTGGHAIQQAVASRFIATSLELGGKDPAYVRPDVSLNDAIEQLVDGAFFNSGQSCCAVERIYVHRAIYNAFVDGFVEQVKQYRLGNPLDVANNLGPMVRAAAADKVREQIAEALHAGAHALIDPQLFPANRPGTPYLAPQVLVDVNHRMPVMRDESFGPVVGIMSVGSDEEAIRLMNDSPYGLTASVWTHDEAAALHIGESVATGTWFMNRCDYLDPALAWVGVKDSGRGCTLSAVGYEYLTRPKSFHLKTVL